MQPPRADAQELNMEIVKQGDRPTAVGRIDGLDRDGVHRTRRRT